MSEAHPDLCQFTKQLLVKDSFDGQCRAIIEPWHRDHQLDSSLVNRCDDRVAFAQGGCEHFFGKDMLASLGSGDHDHPMYGRRNGYNDAINIGSGQQFIQVFVERDCQRLCLRPSTLWCFVPYSGDFCRRICDGLMRIFKCMDMPKTEHSESNHFRTPGDHLSLVDIL